MSRINDCIFLTCDRCSNSEYYTTIEYAENIGWDLNVKLPGELPMDLCPKCSDKLSKVIYDFLCEEGVKNESNKCI